MLNTSIVPQKVLSARSLFVIHFLCIWSFIERFISIYCFNIFLYSSSDESKHEKQIYISTTAIKMEQAIGLIWIGRNVSKAGTLASCTLLQSLCLVCFLQLPVLPVYVQNRALRRGSTHAADQIETRFFSAPPRIAEFSFFLHLCIYIYIRVYSCIFSILSSCSLFIVCTSRPFYSRSRETSLRQVKATH